MRTQCIAGCAARRRLRVRRQLDLQARMFVGTIYLSISFGMSTPPQNGQLDILISKIQQQLNDFVGELTFLN